MSLPAISREVGIPVATRLPGVPMSASLLERRTPGALAARMRGGAQRSAAPIIYVPMGSFTAEISTSHPLYRDLAVAQTVVEQQAILRGTHTPSSPLVDSAPATPAVTSHEVSTFAAAPLVRKESGDAWRFTPQQREARQTFAETLVRIDISKFSGQDFFAQELPIEVAADVIGFAKHVIAHQVEQGANPDGVFDAMLDQLKNFLALQPSLPLGKETRLSSGMALLADSMFDIKRIMANDDLKDAVMDVVREAAFPPIPQERAVIAVEQPAARRVNTDVPPLFDRYRTGGIPDTLMRFATVIAPVVQQQRELTGGPLVVYTGSEAVDSPTERQLNTPATPKRMDVEAMIDALVAQTLAEKEQEQERGLQPVSAESVVAALRRDDSRWFAAEKELDAQENATRVAAYEARLGVRVLRAVTNIPAWLRNRFSHAREGVGSVGSVPVLSATHSMEAMEDKQEALGDGAQASPDVVFSLRTMLAEQEEAAYNARPGVRFRRWVRATAQHMIAPQESISLVEAQGIAG